MMTLWGVFQPPRAARRRAGSVDRRESSPVLVGFAAVQTITMIGVAATQSAARTRDRSGPGRYPRDPAQPVAARAARRRAGLARRVADDVPRPAVVRPRDDALADADGSRPRRGAPANGVARRPERHGRLTVRRAADDARLGPRPRTADWRRCRCSHAAGYSRFRCSSWSRPPSAASSRRTSRHNGRSCRSCWATTSRSSRRRTASSKGRQSTAGLLGPPPFAGVLIAWLGAANCPVHRRGDLPHLVSARSRCSCRLVSTPAPPGEEGGARRILLCASRLPLMGPLVGVIILMNALGRYSAQRCPFSRSSATTTRRSPAGCSPRSESAACSEPSWRFA